MHWNWSSRTAWSRRSRENNIFELGSVVGVHGIKGELKVRSTYEISQEAFPVFIINNVRYAVNALRFHKDNYLVFLDGVSTRTQAESFFQKKVFVEQKPADFVFAEELLGKPVVDLQGKPLGVVEEIMQSPLYDILVVRGDKEILVPEIDRFVKSVGEKIIIDATSLEE